jgi:hypothetical protein
MLVRLVDSNNQPRVIEASVMIVEGANGQPISLALDTGLPGAIIVAHAKDPDFNKLLKELGFNQTVICEDLRLLDRTTLSPLT